MSKIIPLSEAALPEDCYVFKHSTQCPISSAAADEVRAGHWDRPLYWINIIEQRPLSNWVEQQYGIRHESPQLLSILKGKAVAVLTHRAIERAAFASLQAAEKS